MAKKKPAKDAVISKNDGQDSDPLQDWEDSLSPEDQARLVSETQETRPKMVAVTRHRHVTRDLEEVRPDRTGKGKSKKKKTATQRETISIASELAQAAQNRFGHSTIIIGDNVDACGIGIPIPFALEYVIAQDAFPLGKVTSIVGEADNCKTGFCFEMARLFTAFDGLSVYLPTEFRYNPLFAASVLQQYLDAFIPHECHKTEDWQDALTWWLLEVSKSLLGTESDPGPGLVKPVAYFVDGFSSTVAAETEAAIDADGHASRAHPVEALINTPYLKRTSHKLNGFPYSLFFTNQLKKSQDKQGRPTRNLAGGKQMQFVQSLELELNKIRSSESVSRNAYLNDVQIHCRRNVMGGIQGRKVVTRMAWQFAPNEETGIPEQTTTWDWDWALVQLLVTQTTKSVKDGIRDLIGLSTPKTSVWEHSATSSVLGISARDAVSWTEMGALIRQDKGIMDQLRNLMDIQPRTLFRPAVDYQEQLAATEEKVQAARV